MEFLMVQGNHPCCWQLLFWVKVHRDMKHLMHLPPLTGTTYSMLLHFAQMKQSPPPKSTHIVHWLLAEGDQSLLQGAAVMGGGAVEVVLLHNTHSTAAPKSMSLPCCAPNTHTLPIMCLTLQQMMLDSHAC
jgi:hypothetical protein